MGILRKRRSDAISLFLVPSGCPNDVPDILDKIKRGEHIEHYETTRIRKDGTLIQ